MGICCLMPLPLTPKELDGHGCIFLSDQSQFCNGDQDGEVRDVAVANERSTTKAVCSLRRLSQMCTPRLSTSIPSTVALLLYDSLMPIMVDLISHVQISKASAMISPDILQRDHQVQGDIPGEMEHKSVMRQLRIRGNAAIEELVGLLHVRPFA